MNNIKLKSYTHNNNNLLEATSTLEETDPEEIKSEKGWVAVGGWGWWERERERERNINRFGFL